MEETTPKAPVAQMPTEPKQFLGAFELFKPSIAIIRRQIVGFIALLGIPYLLMVIGVILLMANSDSGKDFGALAVAGIILAIIGGLAGILTSPGVAVLQIRGARGERTAPMAAYKEGLSRFWPWIGVNILQGLLFLGGFLLIIVPGFFAMRRYLLAPYYVIDRKMGVMDALRKSAADSITFKSPLWGLVGVTVLVGLVSGIKTLRSVSWIISVLYSCAPAFRYKEVTDASAHASKPDAEETPADSVKAVL